MRLKYIFLGHNFLRKKIKTKTVVQQQEYSRIVIGSYL